MASDPVQGDESRHRVIHYPGAPAARREQDARPAEEPARVEEPIVVTPVHPRTQPGGWSSRNKALAGVGAAVVLGVGLGAVLMPQADKASSNEKALAAATASRKADDHLEIEVHRRAPPVQPVRTAGGKIDAASTVMQPAGGAVASSVPEQADSKPDKPGGLRGFLGRLFGGGDDSEAAPASQQASQTTAAPVRPVQVIQPARPVQVQADADEDDARGPRSYTPRPQAPPWASQQQPVDVQPARAPGASPSFDCGAARTRSEQMICQVPSLAAADRRMARAYADARRAGVPSDMLRSQQQQWYRARDRAAVSPAAVGMVYEQRISELENLRQQAGHTEDAGDNDW